eukprot:280736-Prymnesium_polylepis.1
MAGAAVDNEPDNPIDKRNHTYQIKIPIKPPVSIDSQQRAKQFFGSIGNLSLIHISEPTRRS